MITYTLNDFWQGSEEWKQHRIGKITGSEFVKLASLASAKKKSKPKYLYTKASERLTKLSNDSSRCISSIHIERGKDLELEAREKYEAVTFNLVEQVALIEANDYVACSPDGLVGSDGMIEIKVPDSDTYLQYIDEIADQGKVAIEKDHFLQMQFNMFVCERKWCDYVLYNPAHAVQKREIFIFRVELEEETQALIKETLTTAIAEIEAICARYQQIKQY